MAPRGVQNLLKSSLGLTRMDPHLLLVIFLPPLLFESAYAMDNAIFETQFAQIFTLAIPGVVVRRGSRPRAGSSSEQAGRRSSSHPNSKQQAAARARRRAHCPCRGVFV